MTDLFRSATLRARLLESPHLCTNAVPLFGPTALMIPNHPGTVVLKEKKAVGKAVGNKDISKQQTNIKYKKSIENSSETY